MIKTKISITILAAFIANIALAGSNHNVEDLVPFQQQKKMNQNKIMEKRSEKRVHIDQVFHKETMIDKIDPRLKTKFENMNLKDATMITKNIDAKNEDIFLSGLYFYNLSKYQNMPVAIQQFYKGYKNKDAASTYMYGMMTLRGEGLHANKFKGIEILKSVSGDERYENFAALKLAELLAESGQPEESINIYDKLKTRDRYYLIGKVHSSLGDNEKALRYYDMAVSDGYREANYEIAKDMLRQDDYEIEDVLYLLNEVVTYGSDNLIMAETEMLLGDIHFNGTGYNYSDPIKAVEHYKKSASLGHKPALIKLNNIFIENEPDNIYRLGKNKHYIHRLNVLIKETDYSAF